MTGSRVRPSLALWLAIAGPGAARAAGAASFSYPVNDCASTKQTLAGGYCKSVLRAWATCEKKGAGGKRAATIRAAGASLAVKWSAAEAKAAKKGTNCVETTLSVTAAQSMIDSAAGALVGDVNAGLDLGTKSAANCGNKILAAAAT